MKKSRKILTGLFIIASVLFTTGCKAAIDDPTLNKPEEAGQGNSEALAGTFEISFTVPNQELCNYAEFTVKQNGTALADYNGIPCTLSDVADNKVKAVAKSAEGKELAGGTYNIVFNVYTDENKFLEISSLEESIIIENGQNTAKDFSKESLNAEIRTFGTTGTNSYVIYNKKMFITGTGELQPTTDGIYSVEVGHCPNINDVEEVYIDDGITVIGKDIFTLSDIEKVTGCKGITKIEAKAFKDCSKLKILSIGSTSLLFADNSVFTGCEALEEVFIAGNENDIHVWNDYFSGVDSAFDNTVNEDAYVYYGCTYHEHVWVVNKQESTSPTLVTSGIQLSECSICHESKYKTLPALYSVPSDKDGNPLTSVKTGDIVYLGAYPQTKSKTTPNIVSSPEGRFSSNPYYVADDGECYERQSLSQDGEKFYFHVEPIAWKVLATDNENNGKVLLLSEKILQSGYTQGGISSFEDTFSSKAFPGSSGSGRSPILFGGPSFGGGGMGENPIDTFELFLTKSQLPTLLGTENYKKTCTEYADFCFGSNTDNSNSNSNAWWLALEVTDYEAEVNFVYVNENGEICNNIGMNPDQVYYFGCGIAPSVTYQF